MQGFIQDIIAMLPMQNILPLMLFLPTVVAFLAFLVGGRGARVLTLIVTTLEMGLAILLAFAVSPNPEVFWYQWRYVLSTAEIESWTITLQILLGADGISAAMVFLSNLVVFIAAISSNHIHKSEGLYYSLFLLLQTGLLGVFISLDLISFFLFWELVLIPMFFIIGRWGEEGCEHAAVKFFIYTHLGSAVMLVSFMALFFLGPGTFEMLGIKAASIAVPIQVGFALAVFMGAGVKLPVFPLHNWLPWAHVKAPTPGSVILAGILLKMGGYGFIRLGLWMVPEGFTHISIPLAILAVFTCIYMAFVAMAQTDFKSMVAYTSINHMAWVLLGVAVGGFALGGTATAGQLVSASLAVQGAVFMMVSHGMISSVMFIMAGQMKYAAGSRQIPDVEGLMTKAPKMSAVFILSVFAAFGLPGMSGFIAEALVLFGSVNIYLWSGLIAFGIFVTVAYLLWTLNRVVFSDPNPEKEVTEAPWSDLIAPILMMIPVVILGLWPDLVLDLVTPIINTLLGVVP
ncbi:MAG: NuoM family protein [Promethearchaeota archaeon]